MPRTGSSPPAARNKSRESMGTEAALGERIGSGRSAAPADVPHLRGRAGRARCCGADIVGTTWKSATCAKGESRAAGHRRRQLQYDRGPVRGRGASGPRPLHHQARRHPGRAGWPAARLPGTARAAGQGRRGRHQHGGPQPEPATGGDVEELLRVRTPRWSGPAPGPGSRFITTLPAM